MQDRKRFVELISGLAIVMGSEWSEASLEIYERALSRFTDDQIEKGVNACAVTMKFMPKPVEIIEAIEGRKQDIAVLAWESVLNAMSHYGGYRSLLFSDGRIGRAIALMGGWEKLCESDVSGDGMKWIRHNFMTIYSALPYDTVSEPVHGRGDRMLANSGYANRISEPVLIDCPSGKGQLPAPKASKRITGNGYSRLTDLIPKPEDDLPF